MTRIFSTGPRFSSSSKRSPENPRVQSPLRNIRLDEVLKLQRAHSALKRCTCVEVEKIESRWLMSSFTYAAYPLTTFKPANDAGVVCLFDLILVTAKTLGPAKLFYLQTSPRNPHLVPRSRDWKLGTHSRKINRSLLRHREISF